MLLEACPPFVFSQGRRGIQKKASSLVLDSLLLANHENRPRHPERSECYLRTKSKGELRWLRETDGEEAARSTLRLASLAQGDCLSFLNAYQNQTPVILGDRALSLTLAARESPPPPDQHSAMMAGWRPPAVRRAGKQNMDCFGQGNIQRRTPNDEYPSERRTRRVCKSPISIR
jgi:hypothetical protein